jgi:DNA helicase-2/ATP-dependent DNA helicase PcrA
MGPWTRNFTIYDTEDCLNLIKPIVKNFGEYDIDANAALHTISGWKGKMMSPTDAAAKAKGNDYYTACAKIYRQYAENMRASNAMDFDDLIYNTIRLLEGYPEIKAAVNKRYRYLTADESQDSSPTDLRLLSLLCTREKNICLVGDDFQAIYGFRGSDINAFFDFVEKNGLKMFQLERNYRSTQTVVNAGNSLIANNSHQFEKHAFSQNDIGSPIVIYNLPDPKTEALRVAQIVKVLQKKGIAFKDMAVLYRMSFQSRMTEEAFINNNIPYRMRSGTPFYARKEVKDILAFLRFLVNPNDQTALERALTRPKRGIGESSLSKINSCIYGLECGILTLDDINENFKREGFGLKGKKKKSWENFWAIIEQLNEMRTTAKPQDMIQSVVGLTDYFSFLKKEDEASFEDRKGNVEELANIAASYTTLEEFIGNMTVNEADPEEQASDAVNMMTIHGSKGGEWKAVIVIGCNQGILPHWRSPIEEERRLMYVAITRAKQYLFLTRSKFIYQKGQIVHQEPSVFLNEIDKQYLRRL